MPEEGMEVICTGPDDHLRQRSSKYQMNVESMELAGEGALLAMLEERKKKLAAEGPFRAGSASGRCPSCPRSSAWSPRPPAR